MPATLRAAPVATRRRDRRVSERTRSIADIDTLQENNFDIDPGRHFDHRLILLGALDQIFRHHVARLRDAFAKAASEDFARRKLVALPVRGDVRSLEHSVGIRGDAARSEERRVGEEGVSRGRYRWE